MELGRSCGRGGGSGDGGGGRSQKMAEAGVSWASPGKRGGLGAEGRGLRKVVALGKRNRLRFCGLGTLLASARSQDHRWGLKGEGLRLTWRRVGEIRKGTPGSGRGSRRGRGSPDSGRVSERKEGWRTAGRATPEI